MNHKQKVGYTVLGAIIMLIGIGVGSIVSPSLIAQHNGVFDEIVCSKLKVVDKASNPAIELATDEDGSHIRINDKEGKVALGMLALKDDMSINGLYIYDKTGKHAVSMSSIEIPNGQGSHNGISINYAGEGRLALLAGESVGITISDRKGKVVWSAP